MRQTAKTILTASSIAALLGSITLFVPAIASADEASIAEGKKIAFDKKKGNCLACHAIKGGNLPGNIGPPLVDVKSRYNQSSLKAQISDARAANPLTMMPPFGPHEVLSKGEIDKVVEFIYTL